MIAATTLHNDYDAQLSRYAVALAAGRIEPVLTDLVDDSGAADVQRYVDNAVGERVRMLVEDSQLVGLVFPGLEAKAVQYVQETPRGAYEFGRRETPQFLDWLRCSTRLSGQQSDFVAYQLAEFACLEIAHQRRDEYLRYVAALAEHETARRDRKAIQKPELLVNPVRVWGRPSASTQGETGGQPRPTLFYACREQIHHAAFDPPAASFLQRLATLAPCAPSVWAGQCGLSAVTAVQLAGAWIAQGIVAVVEKKLV